MIQRLSGVHFELAMTTVDWIYIPPFDDDFSQFLQQPPAPYTEHRTNKRGAMHIII
jgi:hypothetical protein